MLEPCLKYSGVCASLAVRKFDWLKTAEHQADNYSFQSPRIACNKENNMVKTQLKMCHSSFFKEKKIEMTCLCGEELRM